jgi:16S rRNA (uracil1498-N3)-methyltransferase
VARELRRLLIAPERLAAGPDLDLRPREAHYLSRVLRLRPGGRCAVVDGIGRCWTATVAAGPALRLEQPLERPVVREDPPAVALELALALPRRGFEDTLRMVTELGLCQVHPLRAGHGVATAERPERWGTVLDEATEQCERLWRPRLAGLRPAADLLGQRGDADSCRLIATTRRRLPLLSEALDQITPRPPARVIVAIGPEGGWSAGEETLADRTGWRAVSLSEHILRTGTAAVAAAAQLAGWRLRSGLSCPS